MLHLFILDIMGTFALVLSNLFEANLHILRSFHKNHGLYDIFIQRSYSIIQVTGCNFEGNNKDSYSEGYK